MKKNVSLLVLVLIIASVVMSSCGGSSAASGNNSPLEGSWKCNYVMYNGEQMLASSEEQASDYTLKISGTSFEANIYGVETSGSLEFNTSVDMGEDGAVDSYTFTTDSGATMPVWHYRKPDIVLFFIDGDATTNNYIAFEKASN